VRVVRRIRCRRGTLPPGVLVPVGARVGRSGVGGLRSGVEFGVPGRLGFRTGRVSTRAPGGVWMGSGVWGGPVDEFLGAAVERPAGDEFEVEVGRAVEDRVQAGLTGDHREKGHLEAVDQTIR
jgi:hypothetical protein